MPALPVIVNAHSGTANGAAERVAGLYRAAGVEPSLHVVSSGDELARLSKEMARERPPLVIAAGGDGTMNMLASALAGSESALGVIPLGTYNHFARDLGIPLDLAAAVVATLEGKRRQVDLGEVNGRVFLNNSSIGLYPAMVRRRERQQRRLGRSRWHAMLWAAHAVLGRHRFLHLTLELDGRTYRRRTPFVFVGNNVYEMAGFNIGQRARLDAGVLSVYVTHRGGRLGVMALAARALTGGLKQAKDFEGATAARLRIDSRHRRLLVATDGEVNALELPLEYRIRPRALSVIAP